jgi:hypothetical protein
MGVPDFSEKGVGTLKKIWEKENVETNSVKKVTLTTFWAAKCPKKCKTTI